MTNTAGEVLIEALSEPERWGAPRPDGGYDMLDPVTREPINPQTPPAWIKEDDVLKGGFAYLREHRWDLRVDVLRSSHGVASDLGLSTTMHFEREVRDAALYGYEEYAFTAQALAVRQQLQDEISHRARQDGVPITPAYLRGLQRQGEWQAFSSFHVRSIGAIAASDTPHAPADMSRDGSVAEKALARAHFPLFARGLFEPGPLAAANMGFYNMREWIMVARLGLAARHHQTHARASEEKAAEILMTVGEFHKDVPRKIGTLVPATRGRVAVPDNDVAAQYGFDARRIFSSGHLQASDLAIAYGDAVGSMQYLGDKYAADAQAPW